MQQIDPRRNALLAALRADSFRACSPYFEPVRMELGDTLSEPGDTFRFVYFPVTSSVALLTMLATGASSQVAVVGREGLVGVSAFLGGGPASTRAIVQSAGVAVRVDAQVIRREFERHVGVTHLLLRYAQALLAQVSQTAVCNRHHTPEQRLCRWLLLSLDRVDGDEFRLTHELIASMLGVRRETVSEAIHRLQGDGVVRTHRGRLQVLDRAGLLRHACECYAVVTADYDRLLPPRESKPAGSSTGAR
ncbi:Crp/Fnr family transcriptional regulator [Ramlibacter sp.]|uniref:Crp/Fnr family transcriptional regulator n=1 Tax=Ramlibacter sp. TaxID=1917967 RepID=UPI002D0A94F4|nr:Crp/Fnr family transcriptional regulator [Ramlibacter sp.]HWI81898.1 Crp/Fnr family transcriptional regulator [Ramlibacter sp.]